MLQGHERSLTQIKFNLEGDLLFSCSKDNIINVWFSHNGERLGTYDGNNGTVWTLDVDRAFILLWFLFWYHAHPSYRFLRPSPCSVWIIAESRFMVSGAADNTLRLWSVQTGKNLFTWEFPTAVKRVAFNDDGTRVVCITEQRMGYQCAIRTFKINRDGDGTNRESFHSLYNMPRINLFSQQYRVKRAVV